MPVRSKTELAAFIRERDRVVADHVREGGERSLMRIALIMGATTRFGDQSGNLRASIGYEGPIAASKSRLPLPPLQTGDVRRRLIRGTMTRGFEMLLPIGMEYASIVNERTGFTVDAIAEAESIFREELEEAGKAAARAIERLA